MVDRFILEDYIHMKNTDNIVNSKKGLGFSTKSIILCAIFAALSAVGAFIRVPFPLIPFTLQFPIVALAGVLLGSRYGMMSQLVYVFVGLVGFPVFTKGGGLNYVFEPTFGYLIGFIIAAYAIGKFLEKTNKYTFWNILLACIIGIMIDYIIGVGYMYLIMTVYLKSAATIWGVAWSGAIIFLPKDIILCALTALLGSKLLPALKKSNLI